MQDKRGLLSVHALKDFHPEGNIIPMEWFAHLKFENSKPDVNAILILADIVYWHRPQQVRDEETGMVIGYRKKFKSDLLQKSYHHYANLFGLSKRQVTDAVIRLEEKGLIQRVFRDIDAGIPLQNVLFIALDVEKVKQLQASVGGLTTERDTPHDATGHPSRSNVGGLPTERETYTKITTNTTTDILPPPPLTPPLDVSDLDHDEEEKDLAFDRENKTFVEWELAENWREEYEDATIAARTQAQEEDEEEQEAVDTKEETYQVCQTMISLWNVIVQHKLHGTTDVFPSSERLQKLNDWHATFGKHIVWECYCTKIANCRFLMGDSPSGFKVTLEWALNPKNVHKVIEGAIYDKPLPASDYKANVADEPTWNSLKTEMQALGSRSVLDHESPSSHTQETSSGCKSATHSPSTPQESTNIGQKWLPEWLAVGEFLSNRLGVSVFKSWFLDVVLIELTSESAVLLVETAFKKYYIENHYQDDVERAFSTCFPTIKTIKFTIAKP